MIGFDQCVINNGTNINTAVTNCNYYYLNSTGKGDCVICQNNYIGNFSADGYAITSCVLNADTVPANFVPY